MNKGELICKHFSDVHTNQLAVSSWSNVLNQQFEHDFRIGKIVLSDNNCEAKYVFSLKLDKLLSKNQILSYVSLRVNGHICTYLLINSKYNIKKDLNLDHAYDLQLVDWSNSFIVNNGFILGQLLFRTMPLLISQSNIFQSFWQFLDNRLLLFPIQDDRYKKTRNGKIKQINCFQIDLDKDNRLLISQHSLKRLNDNQFNSIDNLGISFDLAQQESYKTCSSAFTKKHNFHHFYCLLDSNKQLVKRVNYYQVLKNPNKYYQFENTFRGTKTNFAKGINLSVGTNVLAVYGEVISYFNRVWRKYLTKSIDFQVGNWNNLSNSLKLVSAKKVHTFEMMKDELPDIDEIDVVDTVVNTGNVLDKLVEALKSNLNSQLVNIRIVDKVYPNQFTIEIVNDQNHGQYNTYDHSGNFYVQHVMVSTILDTKKLALNGVIDSILREFKYRQMLLEHRLVSSLYPVSLFNHYLIIKRLRIDNEYVVFNIVDKDFDFAYFNFNGPNAIGVSNVLVDKWKLSNEILVRVLNQIKQLNVGDMIWFVIDNNAINPIDWEILDLRILGGKFWPVNAYEYQKQWIKSDQLIRFLDDCKYNWLCEGLDVDDFDVNRFKDHRLWSIAQVIKIAKHRCRINGKSKSRNKICSDGINQVLKDVLHVDLVVPTRSLRGNSTFPQNTYLPLCDLTYRRLDNNVLQYLAGSRQLMMNTSLAKLPRLYQVSCQDSNLLNNIQNNLSDLVNNVYVRYNQATVNFLPVKLINLYASLISKKIEYKDVD